MKFRLVGLFQGTPPGHRDGTAEQKGTLPTAATDQAHKGGNIPETELGVLFAKEPVLSGMHEKIIYSSYRGSLTQRPMPTFTAFFVNRALSFSKSCQERMGVFSSSPTTMPGPWVGGPPVNSIILAPVFGNVPCIEEKTFKGDRWISNKHLGHKQPFFQAQYKCVTRVRLQYLPFHPISFEKLVEFLKLLLHSLRFGNTPLFLLVFNVTPCLTVPQAGWLFCEFLALRKMFPVYL